MQFKLNSKKHGPNPVQIDNFTESVRRTSMAFGMI